MGNIREDYKVETKKGLKKEFKVQSEEKNYDPFIFPFGTDEALLMQELKELDEGGR